MEKKDKNSNDTTQQDNAVTFNDIHKEKKIRKKKKTKRKEKARKKKGKYTKKQTIKKLTIQKEKERNKQLIWRKKKKQWRTPPMSYNKSDK